MPWRLATADKPAGARACVEQLTRTSDDRLDPLSRRIKHTLLDDLQVVADGGPVSPALQLEIDKLNDCPLDESAGEGYHRETNLAHQRAPAATGQTIVQEVRFKANMARIYRVIGTFKKEGRRMIRYEWRNWKRILQLSKKRFHRSAQIKDTDAMKRVYRMDEQARDNWDLALSDRPKDKPAMAEVEEDNVDAVQREYLASLFHVHHFFLWSPLPPSPRGHPPARL